MFEKLEAIKKRYEELTNMLADASIIANQNEWKKLAKEHSSLTETVEKYEEYLKAKKARDDAQEMVNSESDSEMKAMLEEEIKDQSSKMDNCVEELKILLVPKDPNDDMNVIMEIRAGVGGEEAALFAADLRRMYTMFSEKNRWKIEEIDSNETELGGVKECTFSISGKGAYAKLKFESGGHRVQRVPDTEAQGRVHTSSATVAVLPEVEDVEVEINENDLKIDTYRAGGKGGQYVNKTESAIRITHLPTGIVVTCQDEKSQGKNKEKAMKVLKSRLYDHFQTQKDAEYAALRKGQIGSGDRSERIRTYNFPQNRVSDHRIGLTLYSLDRFMDGDLDEMIGALQLEEKQQKLGNIE